MTSTEVPDTRSIQWRGLKDKRDVAVAMAESGFTVAPLRPNQKGPPIFARWQHMAPGDPARVEKWWTDSAGGPLNNNIAVVTGNGLLVLDFDAKKGGVESYYRLTVLEDRLPGTFHVATQGGGYHVYLNSPAELASGVDVLDCAGLPGVDLRATGGYVVGPGSVVDGRSYDPVNDHPVADAPRWLIDALAQRRTREKANQQPVAELDSEEGIALAREWLEHEAPEGLQGSRNDTVAKIIAPKMKDFGLSPELSVALTGEHWNERRVEPPLDAKELEIAITSGYQSASENPPGIAIKRLAHHEFGPLPPEYVARIDGQAKPWTTAETDSRESAQTHEGLTLERWADIAEVSVAWLVDGIIQQNSLAALYGKPGSYKSFVALHIAAMVASGAPFLGKKTSAQAPDVVYIAAEGGNALRQRLDAIESLHGNAGAGHVYFLRRELDLRSSLNDARRLTAAISALALKPSLIVVDTLARNFAGGNENSPDDMGAFIQVIDFVRRETGATTLLVHHSGKDAARGMRGHSALLAAADSELEVEKVRAPGAGAGGGRMTISKQKDGPDDFAVDYAVELRNLGLTAALEERSSLAIREYAPGESRAVSLEEIRLSEMAHRVLDILREQCAARESEHIPSSTWRKAACRALDLSAEQWAGARKELKACKAYRPVGDRDVALGDIFKSSE